MDTAQLQASFDTLQAELRQVQAEQAATRAGTPQWWDLQRQIADLRQRANEAEAALLEARIAGAGGNTSLVQSCQNRLHFLRQEMKPPAQYPLGKTVRLYHRLDTWHD